MRRIVNLGLLLMLLTICCWLTPGHQETEPQDYDFAQPRRGLVPALQHCLEAFNEFLIAIADLHVLTARSTELASEPIRAGFGATLLVGVGVAALGLITLLGLLRALDRLW